MQCYQCQADIPDDAEFCIACGKPLARPATGPTWHLNPPPVTGPTRLLNPPPALLRLPNSLPRKQRQDMLLVLALMLLLIGASGMFYQYSKPMEPLSSGFPSSESYKVTYLVFGSPKTARLSYDDYRNIRIGGEPQHIQQQSRSLPWEISFTAHRGQYLSIAASPGKGSITCEILINGRTVRAVTSIGLNNTATCSGTL